MALIVWGELPSAYEFNDRAVEASARELLRFVERDYNHPSIVTWVPVNESWGVRQIPGQCAAAGLLPDAHIPDPGAGSGAPGQLQ